MMLMKCFVFQAGWEISGCVWLTMLSTFVFQAGIVSAAEDDTGSFPYLYATVSNLNASFPVIEYLAPTNLNKRDDDRPDFLYDTNQPARIINFYGHWCVKMFQKCNVSFVADSINHHFQVCYLQELPSSFRVVQQKRNAASRPIQRDVASLWCFVSFESQTVPAADCTGLPTDPSLESR
jgi:hypothetical protein